MDFGFNDIELQKTNTQNTGHNNSFFPNSLIAEKQDEKVYKFSQFFYETAPPPSTKKKNEDYPKSFNSIEADQSIKFAEFPPDFEEYTFETEQTQQTDDEMVQFLGVPLISKSQKEEEETVSNFFRHDKDEMEVASSDFRRKPEVSDSKIESPTDLTSPPQKTGKQSFLQNEEWNDIELEEGSEDQNDDTAEDSKPKQNSTQLEEESNQPYKKVDLSAYFTKYDKLLSGVVTRKWEDEFFCSFDEQNPRDRNKLIAILSTPSPYRNMESQEVSSFVRQLTNHTSAFDLKNPPLEEKRFYFQDENLFKRRTLRSSHSGVEKKDFNLNSPSQTTISPTDAPAQGHIQSFRLPKRSKTARHKKPSKQFPEQSAPLGSLAPTEVQPVFSQWGELERTRPNPSDSMEVSEVNLSASSVSSKGPSCPVSLFSVRNASLESCDFLKEILWTPSQQPGLMFESIIVDLNDPQMFPFDPPKLFSKTEEATELSEKLRKPPVSISSTPANQTEDQEKKTEEEGDENQTFLSFLDNIEVYVDPYNVSLDHIYNAKSELFKKQKRRGRNIDKFAIRHSDPALNLCIIKPNPSDDELYKFHQPSTALPLKLSFITFLTNEKILSAPKKLELTRKADLSGVDGRLILVEYIEERPPLIMNFGMGTKIKNFHRKARADTNPLLKFEDGESVLLDPNDQSPFFGDILPNQTIQAIDNNMFSAPISKHKLPTTDFLLIKRPNGATYIREIDAVYIVGQEQPKIEIPIPGSRTYTQISKNRLQAYMYRVFLEKPINSKEPNKLRIQDIMETFPGHTAGFVRERLKSCADFQRGGEDSGWWTLKSQSTLPSEEELQKMVTPENVCQYEGMLSGSRVLKSIGITHFASLTPQFVNAQQKLLEESKNNEEIKKGAEYLEEELLMAPWYKTSNFVAAKARKLHLALEGIGDPSGGRHEAFSYMKASTKGSGAGRKSQGVNISYTSSLQKKNKTSGPMGPSSEADLRKFSKERAEIELKKLGMDPKQIAPLSRLQRISLLKQKLGESGSSASQTNNNTNSNNPSSTPKFARARTPYKGSVSDIHYEEQVQIIWEKQIDCLNNPSTDFNEELQADAQLDEDANAIENELLDNLLENDAMEEHKQREAVKKIVEELNDDKKDKNDIPTIPTTPKEDEKPKSKWEAARGYSLVDTVDILKQNPSIQKVIKRLKRKTDPKTGTEHLVNEYIIDQKLVEEFIQQESKFRIERGEKKLRAQLMTNEGEEERLREKKQRQQNQRDWRNYNKMKKQQEEQRKLERGEIDEKSGVTCSSCKKKGHMKNNPICPNYQERDKNPSKFTNPPLRGLPTISNNNNNNNNSDLKIKFNKSQALTPNMGKRSADPNTTPGRRKRKTEVDELNNIFNEIHNSVKAMEESVVFQAPVPHDPLIAPEYYDIIKHPMDLSQITNKIKNRVYRNRNEILKDYALIRDNCRTYNKPRPQNHDLLIFVEKIWQKFQSELTRKGPTLETLEGEIAKNN